MVKGKQEGKVFKIDESSNVQLKMFAQTAKITRSMFRLL